jgi:hypothetical protein
MNKKTWKSLENYMITKDPVKPTCDDLLDQLDALSGLHDCVETNQRKYGASDRLLDRVERLAKIEAALIQPVRDVLAEQKEIEKPKAATPKPEAVVEQVAPAAPAPMPTPALTAQEKVERIVKVMPTEDIAAIANEFVIPAENPVRNMKSKETKNLQNLDFPMYTVQDENLSEEK